MHVFWQNLLEPLNLHLIFLQECNDAFAMVAARASLLNSDDIAVRRRGDGRWALFELKCRSGR
jgi:hypothetical protein